MAVSSSSADLVVLGAGPAGLAAAWRAARGGRSVVVLERAPAVGGMAASFDVAGVRVDHGSHRLHPSTSPEVLADLVGLLGDDLQLRRRNGRLRIGSGASDADSGAWVGFPLQPGELARRLPRGLLARMAFDAALAPTRHRTTPPASYADALRRGLGPGLYEALYAPFAHKLWGLPGADIDAEQARRRVTADTPWKIAARMLRGSGAANGQGRVFRYPRRGFGQLTEAVAQAAADAGARIELRTEAVSLRPDGDSVRVRTRPSTGLPMVPPEPDAAARPPSSGAVRRPDGCVTRPSVGDVTRLSEGDVTRPSEGDVTRPSEGDVTWPSRGGLSGDGAPTLTPGTEITAAHVFSTVPLPALARIVEPGPPPGVLADASDLRFRAMVLVYLVLDHRPWTPFDAHYLPGAGTPVTRISEPANYRDSADDPADRTVLCAEIPCAFGDDVWESSDADLAARIAEGLLRAGLPPVEPVTVITRRLRNVYPVYDIGYGARLAGLDAWAGSLPRITTFGRLGLFAHDNTHHAFAMAYDAVDALTRDGAFDERAWAAARERFAAHVVED